MFLFWQSEKIDINTIKYHIPLSKQMGKDDYTMIYTVNRMSSSFPNSWSFSYPNNQITTSTSIFTYFLLHVYQILKQNKTEGRLGCNTGDKNRERPLTSGHSTI
ncbi:MAG: hypothetical protein AB2693_17280, partial [Candidatus Thiodiazotropha sp.]